MAGDGPMLFTEGEKSLIITGAVLATVLAVVVLFALVHRLMDPPPEESREKRPSSVQDDGDPPRSPGGYMEPVDPPTSGKFAAFKIESSPKKPQSLQISSPEPSAKPKKVSPVKKTVTFETPKRRSKTYGSTRSEVDYDNGDAFKGESLAPGLNPSEDRGNNAVTWNREDEFGQDEIFSAEEQARIWAELREAEEEAARGGSGAAERAALSASSAMTGGKGLVRTESKSWQNETLGKGAALEPEEVQVTTDDPEYITPDTIAAAKTFEAEVVDLPDPVTVAFGSTGGATIVKGTSLPPASATGNLDAVAEDEEETFGFGSEADDASRRGSKVGLNLASPAPAEVEDALSPTYIAVTDPADDLNATIQLGSSPLPDATAGADDGPDYIAVNDPRDLQGPEYVGFN